jgi:hypothetical protein
MDTDSAHFALQHEKFIDNVDKNLQSIFLQQFDKHFDSGNKISGIWVQEGIYDIATYIGEKAYILGNNNNANYLSHIKGLNAGFQKTLVKDNINIKQNPFIKFNIFQKSTDFVIFKTFMSKNIFTNYMPIKRYFVFETGSLPLKFD